MIDVDVALVRNNFTLEAKFKTGSGITALFGESGSGKSTLLHLIAGLVRPSRGKIVADNRVFLDTERHIDLPPHRRRVGYVFQDALLFPHLNVARNLRYGTWFNRKDGARIGFADAVELLGISHLLDRKPPTLSGGERQRVAIGRALLSGPALLLMDEPLAALDLDRKREIIPYIERLRDDLKLPVIYVSHAIDEVARLADHVVALERGRIIAEGTAGDVLQPRGAGTADRFARASVLTAHTPQFDETYGLTTLAHPAGPISIAGRIDARRGKIRVIVRAIDVTLALAKPSHISVRTMLKGRIFAVNRSDGPIMFADVELQGGDHLTAAITRKAVDDMGLDAGDAVHCLIKAVSIDERLMIAP
ncbi:molybdenum ABC transporter ATP-binding protein [soil metagenome]